MPKRDRLLYVEWDDACSDNNTWKPRKAFADTNRLDRCESVGWLVAEDEMAITICSSRSRGDLMCGDVTIPKACVRKRRILSHK